MVLFFLPFLVKRSGKGTFSFLFLVKRNGKGTFSFLFNKKYGKQKNHLIIPVNSVIIPVMVTMERRIHPFSFRTRKLSFSSPMILGWTRPGKLGHCHHSQDKTPHEVSFLLQKKYKNFL